MPEVTNKQLDLLHHTLGVTPTRREPYRNHFVAGPGHYAQPDLEALEAAGLMRRGQTPRFCDKDDVVFHVTDDGRAFALDSLPQPPKRSKWEDYYHSESTLTFAEWLGIESPRIETNYSYGKDARYRYTRVRHYSDWTDRIEGEWKPTKKEAKASYKAALKKRNDELRAWRKPEIAA